MSNVVQFNFEKTYKEIDINGELYRMEMNDEVQEQIMDLHDRYKEQMEVDVEKLSAEDRKSNTKKQKQIMLEMIDTLLGEGSGEKLYELSGRSSVGLLKLVRQLNEMFEDFLGESYQEEKKKFVKKAK